ncbi:MAG: hypothetical protein AB7S48_05010 [Bacteroidales bacterium]
MVTLTENGVVTTNLINPFPGLRPFHTSEAHLFFGREGQSEEVLTNLAQNKFVAVLGASGTGKSSLIYCGLLPTLYGGFLHNGKSKWKIVITRPGLNPIGNLAKSIAETIGHSKDEQTLETDSFIDQALLKRSSSGIQNVIKQYGIDQSENILILVDQFEELFRYQYSSKDSAAINLSEHFVNLLINAVKQTELPIYVVITMRSDFIGDCSPYQRLTKLINDSHYLIPRMTRDDFRKAVTGPIAVGGGTITDQLVQLLLNEMGNNPDELPILQHALMRTWDYWINNTNHTHPIGINEYEAIGRMERALSVHANEAYDELNFDQKKICEVVFKSLTEKGADNRGIRRPTSVDELARIAETSPLEVIKIVEIFRKKGRTFLTPPPGVELKDDTFIDISHESLMRVWDKLKTWVEDEAAAVKMYTRLADSAELYDQGKTSLWGPPDLQLAVNWREKQQPNLAWASRYNPAFERTMVYLKTSEEEYNAEEENKIRLQKRAIRRSRIVALILGTAGMISIGLGILALVQRQDALNAKSDAEKQKEIATAQADTAQLQRVLAQENATQALIQKDSADIQRQLAERQTIIAQSNLNEANRQRSIAQQKSTEAQEQQKLAEKNAIRAQEQQKIAEQASKDAERRRMLSIAQSMAVKSEQLTTDTLLKGLLAYQSYSFNKEFTGVAYDPDIYRAIYSAVKLFKGDAFNVYTGHTGLVRTMAQSNNVLYSAGSDGRLIGWNIADKTPQVLNSELSIVKKIVVTGNILYGVTDNRFFTYDLESKTSDLYTIQPNEIREFYILSNDSLLVVYNQSINITNSYKNRGREIYRTESRINAVKYSNKKNLVFVANLDGSIVELENILAEKPSSKQIAVIPQSNWGDLAYNSYKNILAAGLGTNQGTIYLWDLKTGQQTRVLRGHTAKISTITFSNDGEYMASASYDGSVRLWNVNDLNTLPIVLNDHSTWATFVIFSNDNQFVFTGDKVGNIRKYPLNINNLIEGYCDYLKRDLTEEEWKNYVGEDIAYKPSKCK